MEVRPLTAGKGLRITTQTDGTVANFSSSLPSLGVPPLRIVPMNHVERGVVPHIVGRLLAAAETKAKGRKEGGKGGKVIRAFLRKVQRAG